MANLRAVEDQEPWRLADEDTDQHSHPLCRMSSGMKMLGARGREGIKRYHRRNERFRRLEINISRKQYRQHFKKWRHTQTPQPSQPMGGRWMVGDRRGSQAQGPGTKPEAVICPGEQDRVNPGPAPPSTGPVEGCEEPRDKSPEAEASQGRALAPHPPPTTRLTASSSQRRHGATARVHQAQGTQNRPFHDREPAPPCPGIRSQKETEIDNPTFTLQPVAI